MGSFTTKVWDLDGLNMQEMRISLINYVWLVVGGYQGTWFIDIYQRVINTNPQFSRDTYQPTSFMDAIGALIMAVPWLPYSFSVASIRGSWRWFILWYESMIYDLHTRKKKHIIILLIILKESSDNFLEYSYNRWFYIFLILKKKQMPTIAWQCLPRISSMSRPGDVHVMCIFLCAIYVNIQNYIYRYIYRANVHRYNYRLKVCISICTYKCI